MHRFSDIPIKSKLTLICMLTSGAALLLACMAFLTYEQVTFKREMTRNLSITARIIGLNCSSALSFNETRSAEQTLKGLDAQPHIVAACVYDADQKIFATYRRNPGADLAWPAPREEGEQFGANALEVFRKIDSAGETIGTIYLQSNLKEI